MAQPAVAAVPPKSDSEILADKIDRLGELEQEEKKLRSEISAQMEQLGFTRHFGSKFRAELKGQRAAVFTDKEKIIALLRKLNLLSKTLVPTQSTILALLDRADISPEDKKQLRALIHEKNLNQLEITEEK